MGGPVKDSSQVGSGVAAYRAALAAAPDGSVNVASIGMTTNLADLLASSGDSTDKRSGYDLVAAKVAKVVYMDGGYNFGCAAGNIGPSGECYGTAQKALKMPPSVRLIASGVGQNPDIYTGSGVQNAHPPNSPCREALKDWCCNPNGKRGDSGRLSWDPIAVMIASLDVGAVALKETNFGTQWTADPDGSEHFFGSGTKNAQTDFTDRGSSPGKIVRAIDFYVNQVPGAPTPPPPAPPTPPTPPTPPPPTPPPSNWTKAGGANCYGARGGSPAHGAKDLEHPVDSSCGTMRLTECKAKCEAEPGCTAVTVNPNAGAGAGMVDCFRKAEVAVSQCDLGTSFSTYVHKASTQAQGFNCYGARGGSSAHGAKDLEHPVDSSCGIMSVGDCLGKCALLPGCTAITWGRTSPGQGNCYRKADVVLSQCDHGTDFDTWLAAKKSS
jgi:hypothetical protein